MQSSAPSEDASSVFGAGRDRGRHPGARQPRDLHGHVADAARARLHEDPLAGLHPGPPLIASQAVMVTSGAAAASTNESRSGLRASRRSSTILTSW